MSKGEILSDTVEVYTKGQLVLAINGASYDPWPEGLYRVLKDFEYTYKETPGYIMDRLLSEGFVEKIEYEHLNTGT